METERSYTSKPIVHQICGGLQIFFGLVIFACDIAFIVHGYIAYSFYFLLLGSGYGVFLGILIIAAGAVACSASCSPETGSCPFVSALAIAAIALFFSFFGLIYTGIRIYVYNSLIVSFIFVWFEIILAIAYVVYCSYFECCHRPRTQRNFNTTTTVIQTQYAQPGVVVYTTQNQPAYPPQGQPYVQQYGGHYPPQYPPQNQPPSKSMEPPPYYNNEGMNVAHA